MFDNDGLPFFEPLGFAETELNDAVFVFNRVDEDLDFVANFRENNFGNALFLPLIDWDFAFALVAHIDNNAVTEDVGDAAGDNFIGVKSLFFFGQPVLKITNTFFV